MKYAHDSTFKKKIPFTLTEKLHASTFVSNFLILSSYGILHFLLLHRRMRRAFNEKSYWLFEMNIRKTLQASPFSFIALNSVEKSVLHILLITVDYVKSAIQNKQQITSTQSTFKENHGNPKKINFQLHYRKFSQQRNCILSYYYRRVTRGRSFSCTFLKIGRKCPDFGHLWVKFLI